MGIIGRIRAYRNKLKRQQFISSHCDIDKKAILLGEFNFEQRYPNQNGCAVKSLRIGGECVVDGNFIIERPGSKITLGERNHVGGGTTFICANEIFVGDDVTIAWGCTIYDHNSHSIVWEERKNDTRQEIDDLRCTGDPVRNKDWSHVKSKSIRICDKVWIGFGATIMKGVTIGEGAVVAANSVVVKDVEPYTVVGGNPAVLLKRSE